MYEIYDGKLPDGVTRINSASVWDIASAKYVEEATGNFRIIAPQQLDEMSVFVQSELPELLKNDKIATIDGIPREQLAALRDQPGQGLEAVKKFITNHSRLQVALGGLGIGQVDDYLKLATSNAGDLDQTYGDLLKNNPTLKAAVEDMFSGMDDARRAEFKAVMGGAFEVGEDLVKHGGLAKAANKLGAVGLLAGFLLAVNEAGAAEAAGDHGQATETMKLWVADAAGSAAGETLGAAIGGIALAVLAGTGITVTAPISAAIVFGATLIGGIFGGDAGTGIYQLTKDLDDNDRMDLLDKLGNLVFGANYTITSPLPADLNGERLTLDTTFSREEIVANAKDNIAWRYALRELNPFVIPDISYAKHNTDGSLDLYDEATGQGTMTDLYLQDRAAMLTWKIRYDRGELDDDDTPHSGVKPYDQDWDTSAVEGNWDFVDLSTKIPGGSPLTLEIDGRGLSTSDHQIVFGTKTADSISGGGDSDHIFGMTGDDTLNGGDGSDYLEGNAGSDSLTGGEGRDTLLGGTGNDTLEGGKGNDLLIGGAGHDTYKLASGDGWDWIVDSDGQGHIEMDGATLGQSEIKWRAPNVWQEQVGGRTVTYSLYDRTENGETFKVLSIQGSSGAWVKRWQQGVLGLSLPDATTVPVPPATRTIIGDLAPLVDANGNTSTDGLGNIVVTASAEPGRTDTLYDSTDNDLIRGLGGDDLLLAHRGGADTLDGGAGNDLVSGGAGDDWIEGGNGTDALIGGAGNDVIQGSEGNDILFGGQVDYSPMPPVTGPVDDMWAEGKGWQVYRQGGTLYFRGLPGGADPSDGDDTLSGGAGNDMVFGGWGNDVLDGEDGFDALYAGAGDDLVRGGADNDVLYGDMDRFMATPDAENGNDILDGGTGNDLLIGEGGSDQLFGGEGDDDLFGDDNTVLVDTNRLAAGWYGDDYLEGGAGNDMLYGGVGNDVLHGGTDNDTLYGGQGDDSLYGEDGNDTLSDGEGDNFLSGGAGDDTLSAGDGTDILDGGADADKLYGGGGADWLSGGEGDDLLMGDSPQTPEALQGSDFLEGGAGQDQLFGYGGNDWLIGGAGRDVLDGGTGDDTYVIGADDAPVEDGLIETLSDAQGNNRIELGVTPTQLTLSRNDNDLNLTWNNSTQALTLRNGMIGAFSTFTFLDGKKLSWPELMNRYFPSPISLSTTQAGASLAGSAMGDALVSTGGGAQIYGGAGNDTIAARGGNNTYHYAVGDGTDWIMDSSPFAGVQDPLANTLKFGAGIAALNISFSSGSLKIQVGSNTSDAIHIAGFDPNNALDTHPIDRFEFDDGTVLSYEALLAQGFNLLGSNGDDWIAGSSVVDRLLGGDGNDYLQGNGGDDRLDGGSGDDVLAGCDGNDVFVVGLGSGRDRISDFSVGDTLQFGAGIAPSDLSVSISRDADGQPALTIHHGDGDSVVLNGIMNTPDTSTGSALFADGTVLTIGQLFELAAKPSVVNVGGDGNDLIDGGFGADTLSGGAGNDTLYGWSGDDHLDGGEGNNTIVGDDGNDTLIAQSGNDNLNGGAGDDILSGGLGRNNLRGGVGNDTYVISRGAANTIDDPVGNDVETILLPAGMHMDDFRSVRLGQDLIVRSLDAETSIVVKNYFDIKLGGKGWLIVGDQDAPVVLNEWVSGQSAGAVSFQEKIDALRTGFNSMLEVDLAERGKAGQSLGALDDFRYTDTEYWLSRYTFTGVTQRSVGVDASAPLNLDSSESEVQTVVTEERSYQVETPVYEQVIKRGGTYLVTIPGNLAIADNGQVYQMPSFSYQLTIPDTYESIRVGTSYSTHTYTVSTLLYERGFVQQTVEGSAGDDVISSSYVNNRFAEFRGSIVTGAGDDSVNLGSSTWDDDWTINPDAYWGTSVMPRDPGLGAFIDGGSGNDHLYGTDGNDILVGGTGSNFLDGGRGADTYYTTFSGDDADLIYDSGNPSWHDAESYGGEFLTDTLVLPDGIRPEDLSWRVFEDPDFPERKILQLSMGTASVRVVFTDPADSGYVVTEKTNASIGVDRFQFSDGRLLTREELMAKAPRLSDEFMPTVLGVDREVSSATELAVSSLFSATDIGDNVISRYRFSKASEDGGYFSLRGVIQPATKVLDIGASELADLVYVTGPAGDDALTVKAFDGGIWSSAATSHLVVKPTGMVGTAGDDVLTGTPGNDSLLGGTGNDLLRGDSRTERIVIKARANLAGDVGAIMELRTNSELVGSIEVRSTTWADYAFDVALPIGNDVKLDVSFVNDAAIAGQDRNLYVSEVSVGSHVMKPGDAGVALDRGTGAGAFDGANVIAGQSGVYWNGALRFTVPADMTGVGGNDQLDGGTGNDVLEGGSGDDVLEGGCANDMPVSHPERIIVNARANLAGDVGAIMELRVNSELVGSVEVRSTTWADYAFDVALPTGNDVKLDVSFVNDAAIAGQDRNLYVSEVSVGNHVMKPGDAGVTLDRGSGTGAFDGVNVIAGQSGVYWNGALRFTLPETAMTCSENDLLNGGAGDDTLAGGYSSALFLGGLGNDTLTTGAGNDVILFNKGDGQDTFAAGGSGSDTLSLGGDFAYSDLSLSKSSNDLVLKMGTSDQITFKDWYATTPSKPVVNLQVIAEAMADFDAGGGNPLLDQKVESFNFAGLASAFDAARAANSTLTAWAFSNALSSCQLAGSDSAALGGDLAYQYGKNGTLAGIGLTAAQDVIGSASFGTQTQTLQPLTSLQTGSVRLS